MKVIGLCGGSGSGKGYCAKKIAKYGIPTIDTDAVYHSLISSKSKCLDELVLEFGVSILANDETVDRAKLRQVIFTDPERLLPKLNEITHKHVLNVTHALLRNYEASGFGAVLVEVPLMFESGFDKSCDFVIAVVADKNARISRIINRDGIEYEYAQKRIDSQLADEILIEKSDFTIVNDGDENYLNDQIDFIIKQIFNTAEDK